MYKILLIPSELSNISGLSKQTLLFYKKKIFISEFKNEKKWKRYRFYGLEQIDIIVTIQTLQTNSLSLTEIQNNIAQRNLPLHINALQNTLSELFL